MSKRLRVEVMRGHDGIIGLFINDRRLTGTNASPWKELHAPVMVSVDRMVEAVPELTAPLLEENARLKERAGELERVIKDTDHCITHWAKTAGYTGAASPELFDGYLRNLRGQADDTAERIRELEAEVARLSERAADFVLGMAESSVTAIGARNALRVVSLDLRRGEHLKVAVEQEGGADAEG